LENRGQRPDRAGGTEPHREQLAIFDDLNLLRQKLDSFQPDITFNLADQFKNNRAFDQNIVSVPGNARRHVHRLRLDRPDALQAQGDFPKKS